MQFRVPSGSKPSDYRILVSRAQQRPRAELFAFNLRDAIPLFPCPLDREEQEPIIDLHELLDQAYERARFVRRINYHNPPVPSLKGANEAWADQILREHGLR